MWSKKILSHRFYLLRDNALVLLAVIGKKIAKKIGLKILPIPFTDIIYIHVIIFRE